MELFDKHGQRKYLTSEERGLFEAKAKLASNEVRTFCLMLYYTGCRISEALNLTVKSIDTASKSVTIESLKKRKKGVFRQVPIPQSFLDELQMIHNIRKRKKLKNSSKDKLWGRTRNTAYRHIVGVMNEAGIEGIQATPKGLRHSFAINCLEKKIPLNLVSKWLGHSSLEVTAIYANALGEEERNIAERMWV